VSEENISVLGKVSTAFGIKGWIKVFSYTDPVTNILDYPIWQLKIQGQWKKFSVLQGKAQGKGLVAQLEGINDRDQALAIAKAEIAVPTEALPELEENEHYWFQLEGLKVVNTDGVWLGQVKELFESGGGNQVMVIKPCEGSVDQRERMLPYVDQFVLEVDLDRAEIQVDWDPDF
jgi:16S rRNA processing protein RimM